MIISFLFWRIRKNTFVMQENAVFSLDLRVVLLLERGLMILLSVINIIGKKNDMNFASVFVVHD